MADPLDLSLVDLQLALETGEVGPTEAIDAALDRIQLDELNAFVQPYPKAAAGAAGSRGPLAGIPVAVKDMFADQDRVPTAGSNVGGHWVSGTATVLERLRGAGAAIVGYTNLHEWGIGTSSAITATGPIGNPRDPARIAGGSSGGSAVAVATRCVPGAIGTDAGGSIRIPAACCGVVGLKPTFGAVPTEGFTGHGGVFDHIGPLARTVADVRVLFEIMSGQTLQAEQRIAAVTIGVARAFFCDHLEPGVRSVLDEVVSVLEPMVRDVTEVDLSAVSDAAKASPVLLMPRLAERLADDIRDHPERFQPPSLRELERALRTTESSRAKGEGIRARVIRAWETVFEDVDVVVTPTIPILPPTIEDVLTETVDVDRAFIPLNAPMNVAGVPSMSLPGGDSDGFPVGVTITAARGNDHLLLDLGEQIEISLRGV